MQLMPLLPFLEILNKLTLMPKNKPIKLMPPKKLIVLLKKLTSPPLLTKTKLLVTKPLTEENTLNPKSLTPLNIWNGLPTEEKTFTEDLPNLKNKDVMLTTFSLEPSKNTKMPSMLFPCLEMIFYPWLVMPMPPQN